MNPYCNGHWEALRVEVERRGIGQYIAPSSTALLEILRTEGFEPLIGASLAIVEKFMIIHVGFGKRCMLCAVRDKAATQSPPLADIDKNWIAGAVNDQVALARAKGLHVRERVEI